MLNFGASKPRVRGGPGPPGPPPGSAADKIVDHVNYGKLRDFATFWLDIKKSDFELIIARESYPNKRVQAVSKTCRLELLIHVTYVLSCAYLIGIGVSHTINVGF